MMFPSSSHFLLTILSTRLSRRSGDSTPGTPGSWRWFALGLAIGAAIFILMIVATGQDRGPTSAITCPAGATNITPGQNIAAIVQQSSVSTAFCVKAGDYQSDTIYPRAGQSFTAEVGAVLEGTNAMGAGIFAGQCSAGACSDVTIRNFVIRNHALSNCVFAYQGADNWTIDHNEITGCEYGVNFGYNTGARITANIIHDNVGNPDHNGGYGVNQAIDIRFEGNELYRNGRTQKIVESDRPVWINNYSHDEANPVWFDGDNKNSLIDGNVINNAAESAIFYEVSTTGVISNNQINIADSNGIFVSTSQNVQVFNNTIKDAWRGLNLFVACDRRVTSQFGLTYDLMNVNVHDNDVTVGTRKAYPLAASLGYGNCSAADMALYTGGSKNITFQSDAYHVPDITAGLWYWADAPRTFAQWQAIPQDSLGSVNGVSNPPPPPPPTGDTANPTVDAFAVSNTSPTRRTQVILTASASDDVGVTRVEFWRDNSRINTDSTAPYEYVWSVGNQRRTYTMTARAYDAAGKVGVSDPITVTVR